MKFVCADVHSFLKYQNVQELKYSFSLLYRLRAEIVTLLDAFCEIDKRSVSWFYLLLDCCIE